MAAALKHNRAISIVNARPLSILVNTLIEKMLHLFFIKKAAPLKEQLRAGLVNMKIYTISFDCTLLSHNADSTDHLLIAILYSDTIDTTG